MTLPASLQKAVQDYTRERAFHPALVEHWLGLDEADARALYELATSLRLGQNQLRDLWEWAEEIAVREGTSIAGVLNRPEILQARSAATSRNTRLVAVKQVLRRWRFPALSAAEAHAKELVRCAGLPPTVRVTLPPCLEGDQISITCSGRSQAELLASLEAALQWARSAAGKEVFALLEGVP